MKTLSHFLLILLAFGLMVSKASADDTVAELKNHVYLPLVASGQQVDSSLILFDDIEDIELWLAGKNYSKEVYSLFIQQARSALEAKDAAIVNAGGYSAYPLYCRRGEPAIVFGKVGPGHFGTGWGLNEGVNPPASPGYCNKFAGCNFADNWLGAPNKTVLGHVVASQATTAIHFWGACVR